MKDHTNTTRLEAMRRRLRDVSGREFWRGLDELADTEEFRRFLRDEFPGMDSAEMRGGRAK